MNQSNFIYNNIEYIFKSNNKDLSGFGCLQEIVTRNEYELDKFVGYNNKHFIDIGANCGVATIILAKQNPYSTIYSFEPDPNVFTLLKENVRINNLNNVILYNYGVSRHDIKTLELFFHPDYSGGNTTYADKSIIYSFFNNNINSINIQCISLDEICNKHNIDEIELLKIDCEGAEYDIIYTSEIVKKNKIKNIVGEFHNLVYNNVNSTADKLINYIKPYINGIIKIQILNI